ncbi:MAG: hypothetical protein IJ682_05420 [Lachnospiraceae bacterium]|nr:hypothetical protein [Lachnospiraceae bacterium]
MLTLLFIILMISFMGGVIGTAVKMTWGITKFLFGVILFPVFIIGMVLAGLMYLAIPILIISGIVMLVHYLMEGSLS